MEILGLILSVVALITTLFCVWFVSETVKKANRSNKDFYDANVRGVAKTVEELSKAMVQATGKVDRLEKAEQKSFEAPLIRRLQSVESSVDELRAVIEALGKYVPGGLAQR